jgi:hypothetical protein
MSSNLKATSSRFVLVGSLLLASATAANGQFSVSWFTVDNGGETASTGNGFSLGGTVGQPDAGSAMSGGALELVGGFWSGATNSCLADIDGDGVVAQADLGILLAAYGTCPGDPGYIPSAGVVAGNACVSQEDLGVMLALYGQECP